LSEEWSPRRGQKPKRTAPPSPEPVSNEAPHVVLYLDKQLPSKINTPTVKAPQYSKPVTKPKKKPPSGPAKLFVLDTNVLMHDPMCLFRFEEHDVFLPMIVLEELDGHKKGMTEVARNARQTSRSLDSLAAHPGADMAVGLALNIVCVLIAVSGVELQHFVLSLFLLGLGWNFLFTGSTTLALTAYRPEEKDKAQGALNFCIFAVMAVSSLASGVLVTTQGWTMLNLGSLLPLGVTGVALGWLMVKQRAPAAA
jgi:hypothetical protein